MADVSALDPQFQAQLAEAMRRSLGGALVQIGNDLTKLDKISKDAISSSGGIGKLEGTFAGLATRMLGPVGVVAGLYQVSNALSNVASSSVQMQAFSRNTGIATDSIKNMSLQLQMAGKTSDEAKATIGSLAATLNDFNTNQQESGLYRNLVGRNGGAAVIRELKEAKTVMEQMTVIQNVYQRQTTERQRRGVAETFGLDPATIESWIKYKDVLALTFNVNKQALEEYHKSTVVFNHNVSEMWKAITGNAITGINKLTEGAGDQAAVLRSIVDNTNAFVDEGLSRVKTTIQEYEALKKYFTETLPKNFREATGIGKYSRGVGEDPIGADNAKGQFGEANVIPGTDPMASHNDDITMPGRWWRWQNRQSGIYSPDSLRSYMGGRSRGEITDFGGMRRRTENLEEQQTNAIVEVRDILKRMEDRGGSGGGAYGAATGGGRQGLGRRLGIDGGGTSGSGRGGPSGVVPFAGKGATGAGTEVAMKAFSEELRAQGVPEENIPYAAAALAGQAQAESSMNPNTSHDGGTGYGIYGARLERRERMLKWLKENGYANNSLEGQARYMAREAMTDKTYAQSRRALMGATKDNIDQTASVLTNNFERPARDNSPVRAAHARAALNGVTPAPGNEGTQDGQPSAFIFHHTGGRGSVEGVRNTLTQRGLGVQWIMDRDGNIFPGGGNMRSHIRPGVTPDGMKVSNVNTHGMEIIAKNDADITPAQVEAAKAFMAGKYPGVPVYGHGQVNPHKQHNEGSTVVDAVNADRAARQRMDNWMLSKKSDIWGNPSLSAKVEFSNVPPGVRTTAEGEGFKELQIKKSRQGEIAGGSPGQPFAGVW